MDHLLTLLSLIPMAFLLVVGSGLGKVMGKKMGGAAAGFL